LGFELRPVLNRGAALGLVVALAVPALITASGYLVSYQRVAIPVLLYLLAMIWAIALGGIVPGLVAAVVGCIGLIFFFLPPHNAASSANILEGSTILALFVAVAAAFASVLTRAQRERWAAEAAGQRLRAVLDSAPVAFILVDVDGRVRLWSPAAERLFGWTADQVLGELLPTVPEGGWDAFREDLAEQIAGKRHRGSEFRARRRDGDEFDVQVWSEPFRDRRGTIVGSLGMVADVSEAKRLQEALRQSQKLESIGKLAGGIAHDFNNVLAVIRAQYEVAIARLEEDHPLRRDLNEVRQAVDQAAALTRQLLAFSRSQLLEATPLDINEVIVDAENMLRRLIGEDIELVTRLDPNLPTVLADRSQIEQVLLNLAVNGREAMADGGRLLIATRGVSLGPGDVADRPELAAGDYAQISVSDSGQGMSAAVKAQAFEPFFTTKGGESTGLGLATVYGIVRQSNGTVAIDSEEGEGTCFTILLPQSADRPKLGESVRDATRSRAGLQASQSFDGGVLLVEDDGLLRRFMEEMLELAGFTVLTASDGQEALELFARKRGQIEVLLTDVVMPRMSGPELVSRIRALDAHVGVIYTSGYAETPGDDRHDSSVGAIVLPKPVTGEQLVAAVTAARNRSLEHV
jgi:PAS domain S-box-containing protein